MEREESIPGDINSVDCKKSVLKGNKAHVEHLEGDEKHPVRLQSGEEGLVPLELGCVKVVALHEGHCGKESGQNDRCETKLVKADSGKGGWPSRSDGNPLEGPEPQIHGWSKEKTTPGDDTSCTGQIMVGSFLLNELLGDNVASREKNLNDSIDERDALYS